MTDPAEYPETGNANLDCFRAGAKIEGLRSQLLYHLRDLERQRTNYSHGEYRKMVWEFIQKDAADLQAAAMDTRKACSIPGEHFYDAAVGIAQNAQIENFLDTQRSFDYLTRTLSDLVKTGKSD